MYEILSRGGARLGNWNDLRSKHDAKGDSTRTYRILDAAASRLYVLLERRRRSFFWGSVFFSLAVLSLLVFVVPAIAQVPGDGYSAPVPDGPAITALPVGVIVVSFVMTAVGYLLNHFLPFLRTDAAKGVAHAVYQAVGVALFELATGSGFGLNKQTGVAFLVAMATWAFSHNLIYKPTTWAPLFGAGSNHGDIPARRKSDRAAR
jgi:hypothetical protein